jgi:hypothetical protein
VSLATTPSACDIREVTETRSKTEMELQEEARRQSGEQCGGAFVLYDNNSTLKHAQTRVNTDAIAYRQQKGVMLNLENVHYSAAHKPVGLAAMLDEEAGVRSTWCGVYLSLRGFCVGASRRWIST